MKARVVIGANYGDEGKGTIVAKYTSEAVQRGENVLNVLTNGGAQRSHTVKTKSGDMTFQHFGSGTYFGANSYYSRYFILNPVQFAAEYRRLLVKPHLIYRDRTCLWTTIYDMMANKIEEELKGTHDSCCMGVWNTIKRFSPNNAYGATYFDTFMALPQTAKLSYLMNIKKFYERRLDISDDWKKVWHSESLALHFLEDCQFMFDRTLPVENCSDMSLYDTIIFENGQGLMLSDRGYDTREATPSNTGAWCALRLLNGIPNSLSSPIDVELHYVSRTYLTRHGDGHLQDETPKEFISSAIAEDTANHYNENQGHFRYGKMHYDDMFIRVSEDAGALPYTLELTHCDEVDNVEEARMYFRNIKVNESPLIL